MLLTVEESTKYLNISRATVYRLVKRGVLEKVKLPGQRAWKIPVSSLDAYDTAQNLTLSEIASRLVRLERKVELLLTRGNSGVTKQTAQEFAEVSSELRRRHPELAKHRGFN